MLYKKKIKNNNNINIMVTPFVFCARHLGPKRDVKCRNWCHQMCAHCCDVVYVPCGFGTTLSADWSLSVCSRLRTFAELISDFVPFFGSRCKVSLMSCAASPLQLNHLTHDCHVQTRASQSDFAKRTVALSLFGYSFTKRLHDRSWRCNFTLVFLLLPF